MFLKTLLTLLITTSSLLTFFCSLTMDNSETASTLPQLNVDQQNLLNTILLDAAGRHTYYGCCPFFITKYIRHAHVKDALKKGAHVNIQDNNGYTPLLYAAKRGYIPLIQTLLEHNADPTISDSYNFSPLYHALHYDNSKTAHLLLDNHAPVTGTYTCFTPLITSSLFRLRFSGFEPQRHIKLAQKLIEHHADINHINPDGKSPLTLACNYRLVSLVKLLIDNKANTNIQLPDGSTPLIIAAQHAYLHSDHDRSTAEDRRYIDYQNILLALIHAGADLAIRNNAGETAYQLADKQTKRLIKQAYHKKNNQNVKKSLEKRDWLPHQLDTVLDNYLPVLAIRTIIHEYTHHGHYGTHMSKRANNYIKQNKTRHQVQQFSCSLSSSLRTAKARVCQKPQRSRAFPEPLSLHSFALHSKEHSYDAIFQEQAICCAQYPECACAQPSEQSSNS